MSTPPELFSSQRSNASLNPLLMGLAVVALGLVGLAVFAALAAQSQTERDERIQREGQSAACEFSETQVKWLRLQAGLLSPDDPRIGVRRQVVGNRLFTTATLPAGFVARASLSCKYQVDGREFDFPLGRARDEEELLLSLLMGERPVIEVRYLPDAPGEARAAREQDLAVSGRSDT